MPDRSELVRVHFTDFFESDPDALRDYGPSISP